MALHAQSPEPRTKRTKWAVRVALIVVGCVCAAVLVMALQVAQQPPTDLDETYVIEGSIITNVFGSRPVSITFTSQHEVMQITAPVQNNHYDIELPAGRHSFEVDVTWNSLPEVFGSCFAGTIGYDDSNKPLPISDFRC